MNQVLVDTSVFVDFFRSINKENSVLRDLINEGKVVLSPFVKLELLIGVRKGERDNLKDLLSSLDTIPIDDGLIAVSESLLPIVRNASITPGLIDYFIVLQALNRGYSLFSKDKLLLKIADLLGVEKF